MRLARQVFVKRLTTLPQDRRSAWTSQDPDVLGTVAAWVRAWQRLSLALLKIGARAVQEHGQAPTYMAGL